MKWQGTSYNIRVRETCSNGAPLSSPWAEAVLFLIRSLCCEAVFSTSTVPQAAG